jgi:hypothetical protein
MAKLRNNEKIERVLALLMSFRQPDVVAFMALRGFTSADRKEGFELLDKAVGRDLAMDDIVHAVAGPNKSLITAIDAWENIWFDVADAALARKFPEVHAKVMKNLSRTSGIMVVLNVKTMLKRLDGLSANRDERAALDLLATRGLDQKQRDYAASLVKQARSEMADPDDATLPRPAQDEVELQATVDAMWAWYLDWSKTARTVVKDKRLRIMMGVSSPARSASGTNIDEDEEDGGGGDGSTPAVE